MSSHRPRTRLAGLLLATALTTVGAAHAEDRATAQELFEQARELMAKKKFAEACPKLEGAAKLVSTPGVRLNLADCYERSGRFASAWAAFDDAAAAAERAGDSAAASEAAIGKRRVAPKRSFLVLAVAGAEETKDLEVHRDGAFVPRAAWGSSLPVDAGEHVIDANAPGRKPWSTKVSVGQGGATATVSVPALERDTAPAGAPTVASAAGAPGASARAVDATKPAAPDASADASARSHVDPTQRTLAYVAGGLGAIGIGVGVFFAVRSHDKRTQADDLCPGGVCRASNAADLASLRDRVGALDADATSAGRTALVSSMVGGVALASGIALFVMSSHGDAAASAPARVTPWIGVGSAGFAGRF